MTSFFANEVLCLLQLCIRNMNIRGSSQFHESNHEHPLYGIVMFQLLASNRKSQIIQQVKRITIYKANSIKKQLNVLPGNRHQEYTELDHKTTSLS